MYRSPLRSCTRFLALLFVLLCNPWQNIQAEPLKIGIVFDKGGKDDRSFNTAAYNGLLEAEKKFKLKTKYVEAIDDISVEHLLRLFAKKKYDLIFSVGFAQQEAVKKVAKFFPDCKFVLIDAVVNAPNVRSILFEEHEGSFLAGALAAMHSNNKIGFIGGVDIPLIRRFLAGYTAGAKYINPKISIVTNYVGITGDAWNNPAKAKELALAQIHDGCSVIFSAAGASTAGMFDAVEDKKTLAIGVDSNQNGMKPGLILTSMVKRIDLAVIKSIEDISMNKFTPGIVRYGLSDGGVTLAMDHFNAKLVTDKDRAKLAAIKADIISGKIKVPSTI